MHAPRKICGKLTLFLDGLFGFGGGKLGGELLILLQEFLFGQELWFAIPVNQSIAMRRFFKSFQGRLEGSARATARTISIDALLELFNSFIVLLKVQVSRVATGICDVYDFSLGNRALEESADQR